MTKFRIWKNILSNEKIVEKYIFNTPNIFLQVVNLKPDVCTAMYSQYNRFWPKIISFQSNWNRPHKKYIFLWKNIHFWRISWQKTIIRYVWLFLATYKITWVLFMAIVTSPDATKTQSYSQNTFRLREINFWKNKYVFGYSRIHTIP